MFTAGVNLTVGSTVVNKREVAELAPDTTLPPNQPFTEAKSPMACTGGTGEKPLSILYGPKKPLAPSWNAKLLAHKSSLL